MVSDFELLAAKILCKPRKRLNEGIVEAIEDAFAQTVTNKALKYTADSVNGLKTTNPEAADELVKIIETRDTEKLKSLFKEHNIAQMLLNKLDKTKLQHKEIKNFVNGVYRVIDKILSEFRDDRNLSKNNNAISDALNLCYLLGLCLFIGTTSATSLSITLITTGASIKDLMIEMLFKGNTLDKILVLLNAELFATSELKLQKDSKN